MDGTIPEGPPQTPEHSPGDGRVARSFVAVAFVALWMAAGWWWKLGVNE